MLARTLVSRSGVTLTAIFLGLTATLSLAADPPLKIIPGKVIVPTNTMRRPWGELVSVDLTTRTGKFRNESTNEIQSFTVVPYAELLHHATLGDLQDFKVGERAIFRLHPNEAGEWTWLTYIQDEMNFLNNHKEYYWVDKIDAAAHRLECTDGSADKTYIREMGIPILTKATTRYWKQKQPASFGDIQVGDKIRTKTHGVGKDKVRVCWEVFLDDESLLAFQAAQIEIHKERMCKEGLPGYVDQVEGQQLRLTVFPETRDYVDQLKLNRPIKIAAAGADRKPSIEPLAGTIQAVNKEGRLTTLVVDLPENSPVAFQPASLFRLWIVDSK